MRGNQRPVVARELRPTELAQLMSIAVSAVVDLEVHNTSLEFVKRIHFCTNVLFFLRVYLYKAKFCQQGCVNMQCCQMRRHHLWHKITHRQPIVVAVGRAGLQAKLCEVEGDDLAAFDGDGVDAGHVVVVRGALPVREVYQPSRRVKCAAALCGYYNREWSHAGVRITNGSSNIISKLHIDIIKEVRNYYEQRPSQRPYLVPSQQVPDIKVYT